MPLEHRKLGHLRIGQAVCALALALVGLTMLAGRTIASPGDCSSYPAFATLSVSPSQGNDYENTTIRVEGQVFGGGTRVYLEDMELGNLVINGSTITATVPAGLPAGPYDVWIINGVETPECLAGAFTINRSGDGQLSNWQTVNSLNTPRMGHAAVVATSGSGDPFVYVLGGNSASDGAKTYLSSIERAPLTWSGDGIGPWQTLPISMTVPRAYFSAVAYGGYIYAMGGETTGGTSLSSVERAQIQADGSLGAWTMMTSMTPHSFLAGLAANGFMDVFGNSTPTQGIQTSIINNDGTLGKWNASSSQLSTPRAWPAAVTTAGNLYVLGGLNSTAQNSVEWATNNFIALTNPLSSWQFGSPMNMARVGLAATAENGYLFAIGGTGSSESGALATVERAALAGDGTMGSWEGTSSLQQAKYGGASVAFGDFMYAIGGSDGSGATTDVERAEISPATLAEMSPTLASALGSPFTLTVTGTNFISGTAVLWNGIPEPTNFVSGTQLTAGIPASALESAGTASVTVQNPQPWALATNALTFTISKLTQTITFDPLPDKPYGSPPFTVAATASSGLTVTFTSNGLCSVTGNLVTLTGYGTCAITAHQSGDADYSPAQDVPQSFEIVRQVFLPLIHR